jgi:hypothetical protein
VRRRVLNWACAAFGLVGTVACGASHAGAAAAVSAAPAAWTCAGAQPASAVVRQYTHAPADVGAEHLATGGSALVCGNANYGYRHILRRHQPDWARVAAGSDWSDAADRAVAAALGQPERVGYRLSNDTFCYSHTLDGGDVTLVVVRASDGEVITAYPGRHQCDASG